MDSPTIQEHIQVAMDVAHSEEKGIGDRVIGATFDLILSDESKRRFTIAYRDFIFAPHVPRQPNPARHSRSFKMREVSLFISVAPFVFAAVNPHGSIKQPVLRLFKQAYLREKVTETTVWNMLINMYITIAKSNKIVFSSSLTTNDY